MKRRYLIWWHNYVDEISRDATTIKEVSESVTKTLQDLNKLRVLEDEGKIKVQDFGTLNPLYIQIVDKSVETEVRNNPIVDVEEIE